jgi:predicted enzyme related to lactoylglutathione lyase
MDNRVIHFEVQADDIERAKKFYSNVFGWEIKKWGGDKPDTDYGVSMEYWGLVTGKSNPGIDGGLYKRSDSPRKMNSFDCTIQVSDMDKAIAAVKANGGQIQPYEGKEKWEMEKLGWFSRAVDSEGNVFGLMQPTQWKPQT